LKVTFAFAMRCYANDPNRNQRVRAPSSRILIAIPRGAMISTMGFTASAPTQLVKDMFQPPSLGGIPDWLVAETETRQHRANL
jgi:hypothetical protein